MQKCNISGGQYLLGKLLLLPLLCNSSLFNLVSQASGHPLRIFACHTHDDEFLDFDPCQGPVYLPSFTILSVYQCLARSDNNKCASTVSLDLRKNESKKLSAKISISGETDTPISDPRPAGRLR